jgi:hypothetical protein
MVMASARVAWQTTPHVFRGLSAIADAVRWLTRWWPVIAPAVLVFVWANVTWAPEGDSALHLTLMRQIAETGSLPTDLPIVAQIAPGGTVVDAFPYSYTPLFHLVGASLHSMLGERGISLISSIAAAVIAYCFFVVTRRRYPFWIAATCAMSWLIPHTTVLVFTRIYSEPLMVASFVAAAWLTYVAIVLRTPAHAVGAGLAMGVCVSFKQIGLLYVMTLGIVALMTLLERRRSLSMEEDAPWIGAGVVSFMAVAVPSMIYLVVATGTVGYADTHLPGFPGRVLVDPQANAYFASITKPEGSVIEWIDRYRQTLLFSDRWLPSPLASLPLLFFIVGVVSMAQRGGAPAFFARLAVAQLIAEALMYATVHGNDRYAMASRTLIYAFAPVGVYAAASFVATLMPASRVRMTRGVAYAALLVAVVGIPILHPMYLRTLNRAADTASARADHYESMGGWIRGNTSPDVLILTPRTYTAGMTFDRQVTWVSPYGNAWVPQVLRLNDAARAHGMLVRYGVDYVLVAAPSGQYVDQVPLAGMRSYLGARYSPDNPYFELAHRVGDVNNGLWLYRVKDQ